jgi:hypothetical protein
MATQKDFDDFEQGLRVILACAMLACVGLVLGGNAAYKWWVS